MGKPMMKALSTTVGVTTCSVRAFHFGNANELTLELHFTGAVDVTIGHLSRQELLKLANDIANAAANPQDLEYKPTKD